MKPNNLLLRCYATKEGDQWSAVCLDLCLAAQADSFEDARSILEAQIIEYVHEPWLAKITNMPISYQAARRH